MSIKADGMPKMMKFKGDFGRMRYACTFVLMILMVFFFLGGCSEPDVNNLTNVYEAKLECESNADCPSGFECLANSCYRKVVSQCSSDTDCSDYEICSNNTCKYVQCKINDDCYDGICTENRCKFVDNTEYITISGRVSDVKNSDIKFFNMEGIFLGATNSDDTGNYSISIDKSIYFDGYRIEVSSGVYGEENFIENLSAVYYKSDELLADSNITLITTLIYRYAVSLDKHYLKIAINMG